MDSNYDVITFISKNLLRRPGVAIYANITDIIKIVTIFITAIFENSRKVKMMSAELRGFSRDSYIFGPSLGKV